MVYKGVLAGFIFGCSVGAAWALAPNINTNSALFDGSPATVGRNSKAEFETPVNQHLTPAGILVELPGLRPTAVAISPDQKIVVTSGKNHALIVMDAATGAILQTVLLPEDSRHAKKAKQVSEQILDPDDKAQLSFTGLVFSPDGGRLYLSDVNGSIKVFAVEKGVVRPLHAFRLPEAHAPRREAEIPTGLAVSPDGKRLYIALNLSNRLMEMDAETGQELRVCDVGVEPYDVVLLGDKVYVSDWAGRRPAPGDLIGPSGRGMTMRIDPVHNVAAEGCVTVVNLKGDAQPKVIMTGLHACALALSPNRRYLAVANAGSDTVSVIDTTSDQVVETICARQNPGDLFGAQPNALAFDKSGKTLYICNGTQNAVAIVQFKPGESKLVGLIPVGWFPAGVVYNSDRKSVIVANMKGLSAGATNQANHRPEYNSRGWYGSVSFVPAPSGKKLEAMTETALADMRYPLLAEAVRPARAGVPPCALPERVGEPSLIKHVIYIIKENRTYDQVLGDMKEGEGDASLCVFGEQITPNEHALSRQFTLLDNTYCCGSQSCDGHQWADSAMATDYMEREFAGFPRSYPAGGSKSGEDAMAYSPAGFIWDDAVAHHRSIADFGEFTSARVAWVNPLHKGKPNYLDVYHDLTQGTHNVELWSEPNVDSVRPFMIKSTVGFDLNVPDQFRAAQFVKAVKKWEQDKQMPELVIMWLSNDHTSGTKPGVPAPTSFVADNDLAMGKVLESISHSSFWKETCFMAIEDDPQAGWDHVSGYRTTAYIAGPYVKRHTVVHTQYNQTSLLRTTELILGLPPMNQMDATATPMFDCFTNQPDFTPYTVVPNRVPLDQMNPGVKHLTDRVLQHDARVSDRLPFDKEDACPDDVLNRILWRSVKGTSAPYPEWAVKAVEDKD